MSVRAIDCWANANMGETDPAPWLIRVKEDYFRGGDEFLQSISIADMLEMMDRVGVEKAVLSIDAQRPSEHVLSFTKAHPERFALAAGVDPRRGMSALWELEELVRSEPVVMARVVPFTYDLPPNDAAYYPLYTKCVELDLPVSVNTGIPGPPVPGECQNPMHLDRVCLYFPELKVVMAHGADPWWGIATRLMGIRLCFDRRNPSSLKAARLMSVKTVPGAIRLTVMPCGASSRAMARASILTPPLDAT